MPQSSRARLASVLALALSGLVLLGAGPAGAATRTRHHHHHHHHRTAAARHHRTARHHSAPAHTAQNCSAADSPSASTPRAQLDAAVVCLINQQRTNRGLPALHASWRLDHSAQAWTDTMVSRGEFDHGTNFTSRLSAVGYDWSYAGENIATGFDTPRQVVAGWMASPGHCRNILSPDYSDVGTGIVTQPIAPYANGFSTWTQDFGLSMNAFSPPGSNRPAAGCPYRV